MGLFTEAQSRLVNEGGTLAVVRSQEITKDFLDDIHSERMATRELRTAEHQRVASVPTSLVDSWLCQGIPFWDLSAREIVRLLERDNLTAFITTDKAV